MPAPIAHGYPMGVHPGGTTAAPNRSLWLVLLIALAVGLLAFVIAGVVLDRGSAPDPSAAPDAGDGGGRAPPDAGAPDAPAAKPKSAPAKTPKSAGESRRRRRR
jgi:hypothetical protein